MSVDLRAISRKERLKLGVRHGTKIAGRIGQKVEISGKPFDLVGVENAISAGIGYQTESYRPGDIATTTQHIAARDLMTPDEIMQIDPSVQLLRVQGKPVIIARKLRYFADREFDGLYLSPDAQPTIPKFEPATLNA